MQAAIRELEHFLRLIALERAEEMRRYEALIKQTPIAQRRDKGLTWYPVIISNEEIGIGEQLLIDIQPTVEQPLHNAFQVGQSAALFANSGNNNSDRPMLNGVIAKVKKDSIRLVVATDELPDWVSDGKLGLDILYNETTYREMELALRKVIEASGNRLAELRNIILGYQPALSNRPDERWAKLQPLPHINPSQQEVLALVASAADLAVIHGPPGTGKTTTLTEAVRQTLLYEKQVLVCAAGNAATDLLTEKLAALGLKVCRIGHTARVDDRLLDFTLDAQAAAHRDYKGLRQLYKDAQSIRQQAMKYKRTFGAEEREQRRIMLQEARQTLDYARMTERFILHDILSNAQVITTTLVGAASAVVLRDRTFDTVFIDEGSQALAPATWIPILRAKRVVIAGDHCQLPPTVKSQEAQREGLGISLFERCIEKQPQAAVMLTTQYRMNNSIMAFSNEQFYKGRLVAAESVKERYLAQNVANDPLLSTPIDYIDTAGCGFSERQNPQSLSLSNVEEAEMLLRYLAQIFEALLAQNPALARATTVGIISPYKEQVLYMRDILADYPPLFDHIEQIIIDTVDGFQGQERDLIAISLVRSNDDGDIGFLSDTRRMNVALTRAKKKLVVIGDSATISNHPFYKAWLDYSEAIGAYKSAWELMG